MQGRRLLDRMLLDESGQDLVEYGLLAAIIAIVGVLIFPTVQAKMGTNFSNWGTAVYNLWAPNNPGP